MPVRHAVQPLPIEDPSTFHDELALTCALPLRELTLIDVTVCISMHALSIWGSIDEATLVGGAFRSREFALAVSLIVRHGSFISFA